MKIRNLEYKGKDRHKKYHERLLKYSKPGGEREITLQKQVDIEHSDRRFSRKGKAIDQDTQLKPTALEVINYKTGTQGYPENVEAFEKMATEQAPKVRAGSRRALSKREREGEWDEARIRVSDMRTDWWVLQMLERLRIPKPTQTKRGKPEKKLLGLKGGDFSQSTINWFKDHPVDLIYLSEHKEERTEARKWYGFKGGIKSKGGGRPQIYHTPLERKKAKAEGQRKRAKEARK